MVPTRPVLVIAAFCMFFSTPIAVSVSTVSSDFHVSSDQPSYVGNATIVIQGMAPSNYNAVTLVIVNPVGLAVFSAPVVINNDETFNAMIKAGGQGWNSSGVYDVTATLQSEDQPIFTGTKFNYTAIGSDVVAGPKESAGNNRDNANSFLNYALILLTVSLVGAAVTLMALRSRSRKMKMNEVFGHASGGRRRADMKSQRTSCQAETMNAQ
jgi:hypothetical protein